MSKMPRASVWMLVTTIGYALGTVASTLLVGATLRPLSAVLAGIPYVFVYGALIGVVMAAVQVLVLPRGSRLGWALATLLGGAIGFVLLAVVGEILAAVIDYRVRVSISEGIIQFTSGAVLGLTIAIAQRLALRGLLPSGPWWIAATAVGAGLGYAGAAGALELFEIAILRSNLVLSFGAIVGLFIAVGQALALRARSSPTIS